MAYALISVGSLIAVGLALPSPPAGGVEPAPWNEVSPAPVTDNTPAGTIKQFTGDFTGDQVPDLLAVVAAGSQFEYWVGVFSEPGQPRAVSWSQWAGPLSGVSAATMASNTFIGDGDPYRVISETSHDTVHKDDVYLVVPGNETGSGNNEAWYFRATDDPLDGDLEGDTFASPTVVVPDLGAMDRLLSGDFTGDGRLDFLAIDQANLAWKVHVGNPQGFAAGQTWHSGAGKGHIDAVGDFTGDGQDDVLQIVNGSWRVARSSGDSFEYQEWRVGITMPDSIDIGDFTGDGFDDVILSYDPPKANPPVWYTFVSRYGEGIPWFDGYRHEVGMGTEKFHLVGDFDGDGLKDLGIVTGSDEPLIAFGRYDGATETPSFEIATSGLALGAVDEAYATYLDANDSHDVYLRTASGNYFLTANDERLAPIRVVHMNRPFVRATCEPANQFCAHFTNRHALAMPNRIPFYVRSVDIDRIMSGYTGFLIGDQCVYIWPKRYSVDSADGNTRKPNRNREEHCSYVHQAPGDPANEAGNVRYKEPVLVPNHPEARFEIHASAFISPSQPFHPNPHDGDPLLLRAKVLIGKAGATPSNLGWILRLYESDEYEVIPAGAQDYLVPQPDGLVAWDEPTPCPPGVPHEDCPFPNTEWKNEGTCTQTIVGASFYNSFNNSTGHTEARFRLYVDHVDGSREVVDYWNHWGVEFKGDHGTVSGSYTSPNAVTFGTDPGDLRPALVMEPGAVVGVTNWHSNFTSASYRGNTVQYLNMKKATDVDCDP